MSIDQLHNSARSFSHTAPVLAGKGNGKRKKGKSKAAPVKRSYYDNVEKDYGGKYKMALPKKLKDIFGDGAMASTIKSLAEAIELVKGMGNWNPYVKCTQCITAAELFIKNLELALPYAVCRNCQGNGCDQCRSRGWWTKGQFESWLQEQKDKAEIEGYVFEPEPANGDADLDKQAEGDSTELHGEEAANEVHETDLDQLEE